MVRAPSQHARSSNVNQAKEIVIVIWWVDSLIWAGHWAWFHIWHVKRLLSKLVLHPEWYHRKEQHCTGFLQRLDKNSPHLEARSGSLGIWIASVWAVLSLACLRTPYEHSPELTTRSNVFDLHRNTTSSCAARLLTWSLTHQGLTLGNFSKVHWQYWQTASGEFELSGEDTKFICTKHGNKFAVLQILRQSSFSRFCVINEKPLTPQTLTYPTYRWVHEFS